MNSRMSHSLNNFIFGILNQVILLILGFVSRSVFIYTLGVEYLGINSLFADVLSLLSMADLGFGTAMVYSFYKPLAEDDTKKIAALVQFYKKIYSVIAIVVSVIGIALMPLLKVIINTEQDIKYLHVYYLFALMNVVISYLFVYRTSIITASQQDYIVTKINISIQVVTTIVQIVILLVFSNYILYVVSNVISTFLKNYISSRRAKKLFPYIEAKNELTKEEKRSIFDNIKSVFLYKISSVLLTATDNIIISAVVGVTVVGLYSNYLLLQTKITSFIVIFFTSVTASIGNMIVTENHEKRYGIFKALQSVSFILCGIIVVTYGSLANDVIKIWLGKDFLFDNSVVFMISLNMYLSFVLQPLWSYRDATGLYRKTKYLMLAAAAINLVLSYFWGVYVGVAGVLLASVVARVTTYFWYEPYLLFEQYFRLKPWKYYGSIGAHLVLTVLVFGMLFQISKIWRVDSVIQLLVKVVVYSLITMSIYLAIYSKTEGYKLIKNKIKSIVKMKGAD